MSEISSEEFSRVESRIMNRFDQLDKKHNQFEQKQCEMMEKVICSEGRHEVSDSKKLQQDELIKSIISNHDELAKTVQKLTPIIASFSILEKRIGGIITALIISAVGLGSNALLSNPEKPKIEMLKTQAGK